VLQATVDRQKAQIAIIAPKAEALDRIATAEAGSLNVTAAAKALQVRPKDLFGYLMSHGWIYRRPGGAGYLGYQTKTNAGDLEHKVTTVLRADGTEKMVEQVLVTAQGLTKLAKRQSTA
jgi:anti-repressor protein